MKAVTFLAYFAALEVATAVHTNETHVWFLSDLSIRHQAGLPSKISFQVTDGPPGSAVAIPCATTNDDPVVLNTTIISDVQYAACDDPNWAFAFLSLPPENPTSLPIGAKLLVGQSLNRNMTMAQSKPASQTLMFLASLDLGSEYFTRDVRFLDEATVVYYSGPDSFLVAASQASKFNNTRF